MRNGKMKVQSYYNNMNPNINAGGIVGTSFANQGSTELNL